MPPTALLQGTLDLLILRTLALGPLHGIGIADRIAQVTHRTFDIKAGSLFPALHRLEGEGWVTGSWSTSKTGKRSKRYTLTADGRKCLAARRRLWDRLALAIQQVLEMS